MARGGPIGSNHPLFGVDTGTVAAAGTACPPGHPPPGQVAW
jgi:hypothetical protein